MLNDGVTKDGGYLVSQPFHSFSAVFHSDCIQVNSFYCVIVTSCSSALTFIISICFILIGVDDVIIGTFRSDPVSLVQCNVITGLLPVQCNYRCSSPNAV